VDGASRAGGGCTTTCSGARGLETTGQAGYGRWDIIRVKGSWRQYGRCSMGGAPPVLAVIDAMGGAVSALLSWQDVGLLTWALPRPERARTVLLVMTWPGLGGSQVVTWPGLFVYAGAWWLSSSLLREAGGDVAGTRQAMGVPPPVLGRIYTMGGRQCVAELAGHGITHLGTAPPSSRCWMASGQFCRW